MEVADGTVFGRLGYREEVVAVADCLMRSASVCVPNVGIRDYFVVLPSRRPA